MPEEITIKAEPAEPAESTVVVVSPESTNNDDSLDIGLRLGKLESTLEEFKRIVEELSGKVEGAKFTADIALEVASDVSTEVNEVAEEVIEDKIDDEVITDEVIVTPPADEVATIIPEELKKPELLSFKMPWSKREKVGE